MMKANRFSVQQKVSPVQPGFSLFGTRLSHWHMLRSHSFILFFKLCQLPTWESHWGSELHTLREASRNCLGKADLYSVSLNPRNRFLEQNHPDSSVLTSLSLSWPNIKLTWAHVFVVPLCFILGPIKGDLEGLQHLEHLGIWSCY